MSPAISIDQKAGSRNPRSTVATVTEIYDYLRLLYARIGHPHCPQCGKPVSQQTVDQIADQVLSLPEGTRFSVLAPLVVGRKGEYSKVFDDIQKAGFIRARVDGVTAEVSEFVGKRLSRHQKHTIEAVVDRLIIRDGIRPRLIDSIETAISFSGNLVVIEVFGEDKRDLIFSQTLSCPDCGISIPELEPRLFSFNSPFGACPDCNGLGVNMELDPDMIIPDKRKSISDGAVAPGTVLQTATTINCWRLLLTILAFPQIRPYKICRLNMYISSCTELLTTRSRSITKTGTAGCMTAQLLTQE